MKKFSTLGLALLACVCMANAQQMQLPEKVLMPNWGQRAFSTSDNVKSVSNSLPSLASKIRKTPMMKAGSTFDCFYYQPYGAFLGGFGTDGRGYADPYFFAGLNRNVDFVGLTNDPQAQFSWLFQVDGQTVELDDLVVEEGALPGNPNLKQSILRFNESQPGGYGAIPILAATYSDGTSGGFIFNEQPDGTGGLFFGNTGGDVPLTQCFAPKGFYPAVDENKTRGFFPSYANAAGVKASGFACLYNQAPLGALKVSSAHFICSKYDSSSDKAIFPDDKTLTLELNRAYVENNALKLENLATVTATAANCFPLSGVFYYTEFKLDQPLTIDIQDESSTLMVVVTGWDDSFNMCVGFGANIMGSGSAYTVHAGSTQGTFSLDSFAFDNAEDTNLADLAFYMMGTFDADDTAISNTAAEDQISAFVANNALNITNAQEGTPVSVYTVDGKEVLSASYNGQALSMASLTNGLYIVKVGEYTVKVMK